MGHSFRTDGVAVFYAVLAAVWTVCLASGITFLIVRRNDAVLRIRGIGLSIAAVCCLHCYWFSVQLGYMTDPRMPYDAEYWIMGTWLPLGVALFHASNTRFLHVASAQKRFITEKQGESRNVCQGGSKGPLARFRRASHTSKVLMLVGAGMVLQILVTVLMYVLSRKWHSSWGIPGTAPGGKTEAERKLRISRGWEWWPTVFWQVFWAWIVAPIILWRSRHIHDTQGWRFQTIACCIANLHATPMWLIALYVPQMAVINKYWIAPQWIAISIMMLEIFTIFLPCWEVYRHRNLKQETLDSIAQWESKNKFPPGGAKSIISVPTLVDSAVTGWKSTDGSVKTTGSNESILTMGALEHVLERNPGPLLEFSALRDFSGENIAFLTSVIEWRSSMIPRSPGRRPSAQAEKLSLELSSMNNTSMPGTEGQTHEQFNRALKIYTDYISSRDAEFQVNLPSPTLKKLEAIFEAAARAVHGDRRELDLATPFEVQSSPDDRRQGSASGLSDGNSEKGIMTDSATSAVSRPQYSGDIPAEFNHTVFDEAEASIKYLVLTNTWPKFVKERRSSMVSMETV